MKNFLLLFITLFSINAVSYASFPITENINSNEVVVNESDNSSFIGNVEFNFGGFILGFLLGLIGVALAYIFSSDDAFRRSAWYGLGTWLILLLIIFAGSGA